MERHSLGTGTAKGLWQTGTAGTNHCRAPHVPRGFLAAGSSSHVTLDVGKEGEHMSLFPAPLPVRQVTFSELWSSRERQPGKCSGGA